MNLNGVALVQSVLLVELVNLMTKVKLPQRRRERRDNFLFCFPLRGRKSKNNTMKY